MSGAITAYGTYANPISCYGKVKSQADETEENGSQLLAKAQSETKKTKQSMNLLSQASQFSSDGSVTDQLSSLVRLTRYAMDSMGLAKDSKVTFSQLQNYCDEVQEKFQSAVKDGLAALSVDLGNVSFFMSDNGVITAHSASKVNEALAQLALDSDPQAVKALHNALLTIGVGEKGLNFSLASDGSITTLGESASQQSVLDSQHVTAAKLVSRLTSQRVDPNIGFSLQCNDDDSLSVNCSDSQYASVLQAFFEENSSLVADYQRSEALSKIEDARKYMRLSPSDMRTRLQLESLASWWDSSGESSSQSSFGMYSGGLFTQCNGINLNV